MSKPQDVKNGIRIRVTDPKLDNFYLIFCHDDKDEYSDGYPDEFWGKAPWENQDVETSSTLQLLCYLATGCRRDRAIDFDEMAVKAFECIHPDDKSSPAYIFVKTLARFLPDDIFNQEDHDEQR